MTLYRDRADAAEAMIAQLPQAVDQDWVVVGLARGGIPIAARIADAIGAALEVLIVRKVGAPGNPELALAAVTGPGPERMVVNETVRLLHHLTPNEVGALSGPAVAEVEARRKRWLGGAAEMNLQGRRVLIVDDGMATGTTMLAAIRVARQLGAARIGVAVPVALGHSLNCLPPDIAPVVCPHRAYAASGVGAAYAAFPQVTDQEVQALLGRRRPKPALEHRKR